MSDIAALCGRAESTIDRIASENETLHNATIADAIRELRWATHNIRNQAAELEADLRELRLLLSRPGR
jgi:hypothetical protein